MVRVPDHKPGQPATTDSFIDSGKDENMASLDPDAPRKHRSLRIPFNEYEWKLLEAGCQRTGLSKLSYVRSAVVAKALENGG